MPLAKNRSSLSIAVVPCLGLGDGLIAAVLAHNLSRQGHPVTIYHPILPKIAPLFPALTIRERPDSPSFFKTDRRSILFYEKLDWMQRALRVGLAQYPRALTVLNPIATPNRDYPFWSEGRFDGLLPFVDNLLNYLKGVEGVVQPQRSNGIQLAPHVQFGRFPRRVLLHPTSSREGKNWTKGKYLELADRLERRGFEIAFILTGEEARLWPEVSPPRFANLLDLTHFVAESGWMIGNDSGIGHLASCVGVPTLTICRSRQSAAFWRPAFGRGRVVFPSKWIPNIKGMRWRDRTWQRFISVDRVERAFMDFAGPLVTCARLVRQNYI